MAPVTFAEAARRLGMRSRSTLYRLKEEQRLEPYLVAGPKGSQLLELTPQGKPSLEAYLAAVLDPGRGPGTGHRDRRERRDRRWELVAGLLSEALAVVRGPSLTAKEAELVAEQLGPATREVFPEGLPQGAAPEEFLILSDLWNPMAPEVNRALVADGWKLPNLTGAELLAVCAAVDAWQEETHWDTESRAWWEEALADASPGDPCPDPWRCEWCGEPWHHNHPEFHRPPAVQAYVDQLRARFKTSQDIPEEEEE